MYVGKLQTALMYHLSMIYCHSSYRMNVRNVGGIFIGQILNENHYQMRTILNYNKFEKNEQMFLQMSY